MINLLLSLNVMFCDIKGEIQNPGVYEITNNNINDVINLSGGLTKNAYVNNINLSKKVTDEMVIYIPSKYEKPKACPPCNCPLLDCKDILPKPIITTTTKPMTSIITTKEGTLNIKTTKPNTTIKTTKSKEEIINTTTTSTTTKTLIVNINTASIEELQTLHGIGEKTALKIIEYRNETPFIVIEDLLNVKGIGEATFAKIKDFITV